ncbi:hypothetical protein M409DRAFT_55708 [Zasmidium cellare ATCC 36951]|uniref:Epoxide hydrolase N-terminal domain-containing protein n=1 Tax=Zasmidium cellare ATCC 36951 TaxID=1080233 RepID=A0A6A6CDW4_ZASCE|nr:uncharacterized protein M409DRAFT_55708 [Zasmidium cellare ATCC 36951]KAF2165285.1 hypothetical protein M409DRAFT_55708 [Zasmidium cellare ATCC 36951]
MAQGKPFGNLPSGATSNVKPYELHIPEADVQNMKNLLKLCRLAGPVYENSMPGGKRTLGVRRDWLADAKQTWETDFDWRASESHMNSFPNFKAPVEDKTGTFEIHFLALISSRVDAIPVILLHGWPGSFLEFLPMLQLFKEKYTPETLPYHLVVPSIPGFTLSAMPLLDRDISQGDAARILNKLMVNLGFGSGYVAQGGDIGSKVARILAVNHKEAKGKYHQLCIKLTERFTVNFCPMGRPASATDDSILSEVEKKGLERGNTWKAGGNAYALEQATRPSTIGFVLSSNPLALLAWIGEKYLEWTDDPKPSLTSILESCSLYWLTGCAHSNLWSYRHSFGPGQLMAQDDPRYYIDKPFGFSYYPKETAPTPISWVATTGRLVWSKAHDKGGHFAALERPSEFVNDLEAFIGQVWSRK